MEVYYQADTLSMDWTAAFRPFKFSVWLTIAAWMLIAPTALTIVYQLSKRHNQHNIHPEDFRQFPGRHFFFVLQAHCLQGNSSNLRMEFI